jgi:hypothetical protein
VPREVCLDEFYGPPCLPGRQLPVRRPARIVTLIGGSASDLGADQAGCPDNEFPGFLVVTVERVLGGTKEVDQYIVGDDGVLMVWRAMVMAWECLSNTGTYTTDPTWARMLLKLRHLNSLS